MPILRAGQEPNWTNMKNFLSKSFRARVKPIDSVYWPNSWPKSCEISVSPTMKRIHRENTPIGAFWQCSWYTCTKCTEIQFSFRTSPWQSKVAIHQASTKRSRPEITYQRYISNSPCSPIAERYRVAPLHLENPNACKRLQAAANGTRIVHTTEWLIHACDRAEW